MGVIPSPRTVFPESGPSFGPVSQGQGGDAASLFNENGGASWGGVAVDKGESAVITVYNNAAGVSLQVNIRIAIPPDKPLPNVADGLKQGKGTTGDRFQIVTKVITPTTAGAVNTFTIPLFKGFVQSVYVAVTAGTPGATDTYCEVGIASGSAVRVNQWIVLLSGFVTSQYALSSAYPNNNSISGQGTLTLWEASGTATASITQTVATNIRWTLKWVSLALTTSAAAGNRRPRVRLTRTAVILDVPSRVDQAASTTVTHLWADGLTTDTALDTITAGTDLFVRNGLPPAQSKGADVWSVVFTGNQAGDTMVIKSQFEQWVGA